MLEKKMMSSSSNHYVTLKPSRKRKETEGGFETLFKKSTPSDGGNIATKTVNKVETGAPDNKILAGYFAHEFLTHGTLFGQKWDRARAEAMPLSSSVRKGRNENNKGVVAETAPPSSAATERQTTVNQSYVDVARLLKIGGVHIPGIVNPTQLAELLQM